MVVVVVVDGLVASSALTASGSMLRAGGPSATNRPSMVNVLMLNRKSGVDGPMPSFMLPIWLADIPNSRNPVRQGRGVLLFEYGCHTSGGWLWCRGRACMVLRA